MKLFRYIQKCNTLIFFCVSKGASTHIKNHNAITKERNRHITETEQSVEEPPPPAISPTPSIPIVEYSLLYFIEHLAVEIPLSHDTQTSKSLLQYN